MKMPAKSKLDRAEQINSLDRQALQLLQDRGIPFNVPDFCKGDIRDRMLKHVGGDNVNIILCFPNAWVNIVTANMDQMEKDLIREFNPSCNQRVG